MRHTKVAIMVTACCFMLALPAFADIVTIDFGTGLAGVGGSFTLTGPNASGTNIPIGAVNISGASTNNGTFVVDGSCGGFGCLDFDTSTNTIVITGYIPGLLINAPESLLSGSFTSWIADLDGISRAKGPDSKATNLLAALGLPSDQAFKYFGFSITTNYPTENTVISTDVKNTTVPDGGSTLILLGVAIVGIGTIRRKLCV